LEETETTGIIETAETAEVTGSAGIAETTGITGAAGAPKRDSTNVVYIGKKGVMSYVLAVVTQFNHGAPEVTIKARGKTISRAVDVAEIVRNKFLTNVSVKSITTSTEELQAEDGTMVKVSAIEIVLAR
jgi:DNA-binding protein